MHLETSSRCSMLPCPRLCALALPQVEGDGAGGLHRILAHHEQLSIFMTSLLPTGQLP